jgi:hypothetical protein
LVAVAMAVVEELLHKDKMYLEDQEAGVVLLFL